MPLKPQPVAIAHWWRQDGSAFSACELGQHWQQALGLLAVTQRTAVLSNAISYNAVFSACGKGQQWQHMQQSAGLPNVIYCSAAINSWEKGQAMAAGLGSFGGEAADCCSA